MHPVKIAIVDDHPVFRDGLKSYIQQRISGYEVSLVAENGNDLLQKLREHPRNCPAIILMDIEMGPMNGVETTHVLSLEFPKIKVIAMTAFENPETIFKMLSVGVRGYFVKGDATEFLQVALDRLMNHGYFFSDTVLETLADPNWQRQYQFPKSIPLSERETEFVRLACSDYPYKEIARRMGVSENTVADYREHTFKKLNVKSRQGLVLHAFMYGLLQFDKKLFLNTKQN